MSFTARVKRYIKRKTTPCRNEWPKERLIEEINRKYQKNFGRYPDLENPALFTEKMQWYKLYYKNDLIPKIVDKYDFKHFIKSRLGEGHTIPLYGVYDTIGELMKAWDDLPEEFCLKSTVSGNGKNIKIIRHKSKEDPALLKKEVKHWFDPKTTLINSFGSGYYSCKARVIAEQYMENIEGQLFDYKIFCFDGEPYCIYAASEHFKWEDHQNGYPISFYDLNWKMMDVQYGDHRNEEIPKPGHLSLMIEEARILSRGFPYVRVDFFDTDEKLYLAEMTFYPGGGMTQYHPAEFDKELGDMFHLPNEQ